MYHPAMKRQHNIADFSAKCSKIDAKENSEQTNFASCSASNNSRNKHHPNITERNL